MKKITKKIIFTCIITAFIVGCGINNSESIIKKIDNKYNKANSYYAEGTMEILNNENTYTYNVKVSYKKNDYYKIDLTNTLNNHEQVILKNDDGVFVVTPSLNKSFKFQSDWPYNNSQVYLLNSIIDDIKEDENRKFKEKKDYYFIISSVNYPNNKSLVKQNVYINKNMKISKVEVTDKEGKVQIKMKFNKLKFNKKFENNYFELSKLIKINETNNNKKETNNTQNNETNNNNSNIDQEKKDNNNTDTNQTEDSINNSTEKNKEKQTASINDVVYPMYLPNNTSLANKEVINTNDGERLILTFSGDNPFVLVEETLSYNENGLIIPVSGNLDFLNDVIGVINDNSVSFESNGIGYYIVSDKLEKTELVNIAKSISILPVSK